VVTALQEDLRDEVAVINHVIETQPQALRLSDLIRELGDSDKFKERDRIERAVGHLVATGLLFRCQGAVLPTRQAVRAYELFNA
jgi:hypothetical protein